MDVRFGKMISTPPKSSPKRWNGRFLFGQRFEVELVFR
jgi:hypothetical protein